MSFFDEEFVYEHRLKSEYDRWISQYDMLEARRLSKEADEKQKKEIQELLNLLKNDILKVETILANIKDKSIDVLHSLQSDIKDVIISIEQKIKEINNKLKIK